MLLMIDNYDSFTYATNVRLRVGGRASVLLVPGHWRNGLVP